VNSFKSRTASSREAPKRSKKSTKRAIIKKQYFHNTQWSDTATIVSAIENIKLLTFRICHQCARVVVAVIVGCGGVDDI
jgi:hypothetical protein